MTDVTKTAALFQKILASDIAASKCQYVKIFEEKETIFLRGTFLTKKKYVYIYIYAQQERMMARNSSVSRNHKLTSSQNGKILH